jgi:hypothetical protein
VDSDSEDPSSPQQNSHRPLHGARVGGGPGEWTRILRTLRVHTLRVHSRTHTARCGSGCSSTLGLRCVLPVGPVSCLLAAVRSLGQPHRPLRLRLLLHPRAPVCLTSRTSQLSAGGSTLAWPATPPAAAPAAPPAPARSCTRRRRRRTHRASRTCGNTIGHTAKSIAELTKPIK